MQKSKVNLDKLIFPHFQNKLYSAGYPRFLSNFSRDSLIAGFLFNNPGILAEQLIFSASQQGKAKDSYTGEEIGKIHHEIPEVAIRGRTTRYAACDTTALFVLGHQKYIELTGDKSLFISQKENILLALNYIQNHIKNGYFMESPEFSGGDKFALKVTYWKDSNLIYRPGNEPVSPICYTLVQTQYLAAVRFLAKEFDSQELRELAKEMLEVLKTQLFDSKNKEFCIAKDKLGSIFVESSDSLHMLYYLEKGDLDKEHILAIIDNSNHLETKVGYRTMIQTDKEVDQYHSKTVWPFEQAIIHAGAIKFDLPEIAEISRRCYSHFGEDNSELFLIRENGHFGKGGNENQLWTIAAKVYFRRVLG